jgi:hypothetical protein
MVYFSPAQNILLFCLKITDVHDQYSVDVFGTDGIIEMD